MKTARDVMTSEVFTFTADVPVTQAAKTLLERKINGAPVVDASGAVVGVLTQADLVAQQKKTPTPSVFSILDGFIPLSSMASLEKEFQKIAALTVGQAMTDEPVTVAPDATIEEIAALMVDSGLHTLPVVENGKLVGVIGKEDVLRSIIGG